MKEQMNEWMKLAGKIALPLILLCFLVLLAAFAERQQSEQRCEKINVHILDEGEFRFVSDPGVIALITRNGAEEIIGKKASAINLQLIESRIQKNAFVQSADAHIDMSGELEINLKQREPIIRVINPLMESYYLDREGRRMPLSRNYTAYVPVATPEYYTVTGNKDSIIKALDSSLFILAEYLQKDSFARALTGQILIEHNNEFTMIPRLGNFTIFIGDVADIDDKMKRLKSFYRVSLPQAGWKKYSRISLKYKNQIIANH